MNGVKCKMIGLLDYDFCTSKKNSVLIPNLEIMKLATYYKIEENQFCKLLSLEETDLSAYDLIFFFSEFHNKPNIPNNYLRNSNVIYGGSALTNNKYVPFENEIIDYTLPRPFIYQEFLKDKYKAGIKAKVISHFLDDTYYRNYAGNKKLPLPAIKSNHRVYLYDRDFFYEDWQNTIENCIRHKPASIIHLHPIVCKKITDYFLMRSYSHIARSNTIILDLNIPLSETQYLMKESQYKNKLLADITSSSNVGIFLGGEFQVNNQFIVDFIYKMNLLFVFWSNNIPIKIYYNKPSLLLDNPLEKLSIAAMQWVNSNKIRKMTLEDYIATIRSKELQKNINKERIVLFNYDNTTKDLFHYISQQLQKMGWRI